MSAVAIPTFLDIDFRDDLGVLMVRWKEHVPEQDLQEAYQQLLSVAEPLQVHYWFMDLRRRGPVSREVEEWILRSFFPELESRLPGSHYFAYLVTPTHLLHVESSVGLERLHNMSKHTRIRIFDSEKEALQWLQFAQLPTGN